MAELKPCPFCGGGAEYFNFIDYCPQTCLHRPVCFVRCTNCKTRSANFVAEDSTFEYKDAATKAWNRRAEDDS